MRRDNPTNDPIPVTRSSVREEEDKEMARTFLGVIVMMLVSTALVATARADEAIVLLCEVLLPPTPDMPIEMRIGKCQASAGAEGMCPPERTSCAEGLAAILSRPGFKLKGQSSSGNFFGATLYTIVNPHAGQ